MFSELFFHAYFRVGCAHLMPLEKLFRKNNIQNKYIIICYFRISEEKRYRTFALPPHSHRIVMNGISFYIFSLCFPFFFFCLHSCNIKNVYLKNFLLKLHIKFPHKLNTNPVFSVCVCKRKEKKTKQKVISKTIAFTHSWWGDEKQWRCTVFHSLSVSLSLSTYIPMSERKKRETLVWNANVFK